MTNGEAVNWLINISADIGKVEHRDLWHYEQALSEIREMLEYEESEPKWIPCSERLPEEDGDYLVTYEKGYAEDYGFDLIGIAPFEVDCEGFGIWQEQFDHHTLGSLGSEWVDIKVTAWMPLPEPYAGRRTDE